MRLFVRDSHDDVPATQELFRSLFDDCTKELTQNISMEFQSVEIFPINSIDCGKYETAIQ